MYQLDFLSFYFYYFYKHILLLVGLAELHGYTLVRIKSGISTAFII